MYNSIRNISPNMNTRKQANKRSRSPQGKSPEKRQNRRESGSKPVSEPVVEAPARTSSPASDRWIFGFHAVSAALANPNRTCNRLLLTTDSARRADDLFKNADKKQIDRSSLHIERTERSEIERYLPAQAVHQGIALETGPLPARDIADISEPLETGPDIIIMLDQVTDPHNIGAILRSAASFGARAVIMQDRNAPPETGTMAKAASGAMEVVPIVRVANLSRALENLAERGYWRIGLAAEGAETMAEADPGPRVVLVLGAEGSGLRRLTAQNCDMLCRLPMATSDEVTSLNVSNAAAVALYELVR